MSTPILLIKCPGCSIDATQKKDFSNILPFPNLDNPRPYIAPKSYITKFSSHHLFEVGAGLYLGICRKCGSNYDITAINRIDYRYVAGQSKFAINMDVCLGEVRTPEYLEELEFPVI